MSNDQKIAELANTTKTTVTDWVPPAGSDYAAVIIQKAQVARVLKGVAAASSETKEAKTGASQRVRIFPKRTAQGAISEGSSLTATETTSSYADVTLSKYGDYDQLTGEAGWQTNIDLQARIFNAMATGLANKFDDVIWTALEGATPGASKSLAVTGDLTTNDDFAQKLLDLRAAMRKLDVKPDYILCGPDQIAALLKMKTINSPVGAMVALDEEGNVSKFAGMKVVDLMSIANANATTASMVHAIMIDSSRAYAELNGPSKFETDRVIESDLDKLVAWAYFGAATADTQGIGHVINPA